MTNANTKLDGHLNFANHAVIAYIGKNLKRKIYATF